MSNNEGIKSVYILIIINFVVFFIFNYRFKPEYSNIVEVFGLVSASFIKRGFLWQPLTYLFLHGNFTHIFWNMFALFMFGIPLEMLWGKNIFLSFYFLSGIISGIIASIIYLFIGLESVPIIGASSAIYALLMGFALSFPDELILLFFIIPIKAKYTPILFAVIDLFLGLKGNSNIAYFAHLAGLAAGFVLYLIIFKKKIKIDFDLKNINRFTKNIKNSIGNITEEDKYFLKQCLYKIINNIYFSDFEIKKLQKLVVKQGDTIVVCNEEEFSPDKIKCLKCKYLPYCILREIKRKNLF